MEQTARVPPEYAWKVWYEDGSTFSSLDGAPHESPSWGSAVVSQPNRKPEVLGAGEPYFIYRADLEQWIASDFIGLIDQFTHFAHHITCLRVGRWVLGRKDFTFKDLHAQAAEECRLLRRRDG